MHPEIEYPKSYLTSLRYNEKKVKEKKGECIEAHNFLQKADELTHDDVKERFDRILSLNERVLNKGVTVTLGFDRSDNLTREKMGRIAKEYMERIGFGDQPYLVFRHTDAGHPHLHLVSVSIRHDGSHIHNSRIGTDLSSVARIAIEEKYGLVKAKGEHMREDDSISLPAQKIRYGELPTRQAMYNVMSYVFENYRFRSLSELNAIFRLYNLRADGGKPGSKMNQRGGLIYMILDEKGKGIGAPQKASSFDLQPTLAWLEKKFYDNMDLDPMHLKSVQSSINASLRSDPRDWEEFSEALRKVKIQVIGPHESTGFLHDLHFVDLRGMQVVTGKELGKETLAKINKIPLKQIDQAKNLADEPGQQKQQKRNRKSRHL